MEAVIFTGIQGSGKTTFYRERFFETHVRVSLDQLRTRHRERLLVETLIAMKQPFVVDNTNPTAADRARYLVPARAAGYRIAGYFFEADFAAALRRNATREGKARIRPAGIGGTLKRLERPDWAEGFDRLAIVTVDESGGFEVRELPRPEATPDAMPRGIGDEPLP